jgi:ABC-type phosphate transport system substrate-binding protein
MRRISKIGVLAAAISAAVTFSAGLVPAHADPPAGTLPALTAVVGVGALTTQGVMNAMATGYDATKPANKLYSWDAVNPVSGQPGDNIVTKGKNAADKVCMAPRPNMATAGITALTTAPSDAGQPCINYARSDRGPGSSGPAGLTWYAFAKDAVAWVTNAKATGVPATLTAAQLNLIYTANVGHCVTWNHVGGTSTAAIVPALPQASSGTRTYFLAAIGVAAPGTCVVNGQISIPGDPLNPVPLEENTAVSTKNAAGQYYTGNAFFFANNANALYPYSVADWIAQQPAPAGGGHATPSFGSTGVTKPKDISGVSPITVGTPDTISAKFTSGTATVLFTSLMYNAVLDVTPAITKIFGPKGFVCSAAATIKNWGFLGIGGSCGG